MTICEATIRMTHLIYFQLVLFTLGLFCNLLANTAAQCITGKYEECNKADFIPRHNLGGEGFDITTMTRKRAYVIYTEMKMSENNTCTLCKNRLQKNKYQVIPLYMVDWRISSQCQRKVSSSVYQSAMSFSKSSSSQITNDWKVGLNGIPIPGIDTDIVLAGSHSKLSEFAMKKSNRDKYCFTKHVFSCNTYTYRLRNHPRLESNFLGRLKNLPKEYNSTTKQRFFELIDIYGTHYINKVQLGGRIQEVTALRTCQMSLEGMTSEEVRDCLDMEASANAIKVKGSFKYKWCQTFMKEHLGGLKFSEKYNERSSEVIGGSVDKSADLLFSTGSGRRATFKAWTRSLVSEPDVISYSLTPLHMLVDSDSHIKMNLGSSITDYIKEKAIQKNCNQCPLGKIQNQRCVCGCLSSNTITSNCCSRKKGTATLTVMVLHGVDVYGYIFSTANFFVNVSFDSKSHRTDVIQSHNPHWNYTMDFGDVILYPSSTIKVIPWDMLTLWNTKLGECVEPITHAKGWQEFICYLNKGKVILAYNVKCGPYLGGLYCDQYHTTPI
ncbi:perforin-1-like [Protopterus annectens]|uniref:perforin-1-like n=1 Tax=Protopterus annectens TaxID=7888 RepID=UPI001CFACF46|nr:perforin-1-like [Protopterus annectens]XP_043942173.1 perforin-1-like [Protopterus annectens]